MCCPRKQKVRRHHKAVRWDEGWYNRSVNLRNLHRWDVTAQEAVVIQRDLASRVSFESVISEPVRYVAGLDLSAPDAAGKVKGAVVVLSYPEL